MKACGIVAEYNPFHKGHAYQIEQVRQLLDEEVAIIAVMSGNFLQRGEPALVDKWTRARMALSAGADLVVELPVMWSTQPADFFAQGAMTILQDLGIRYLSFGAESGKTTAYLQAAKILVEQEAEILGEIKNATVTGIPYAQQMEAALLKLAPEFPINLATPNNQLGVRYVTEIVRRNLTEQIDILPIERKGAAYLEASINKETEIASATGIRQGIFAGESSRMEKYIPAASYAYLAEALKEVVSWEAYFPLLKYQLLVQSANELRTIYQMTEGLENRLKKYIEGADTFADFISKIKTKRYTQTRLQRLLVYVLLGMKAEEVAAELQQEPAIRILGFTQRGQEYLSQQKHHVSGKLVTNVKQSTQARVAWDIKAGNIYRLGNHFIQKQDFTRKPIKFD